MLNRFAVLKKREGGELMLIKNTYPVEFVSPHNPIRSVEMLLSLPELCTLDKLPLSAHLVKLPLVVRYVLGSIDFEEMLLVRFGTSGGIFLAEADSDKDDSGCKCCGGVELIRDWAYNILFGVLLFPSC